MKTKSLKGWTAVLLSSVLTAIPAIPAMGTEVTENTDVVYIQNADDLIHLAESCSTDTWSHGKTVILQNDISFDHIEFTGIPTFGGIFKGNGHTIRGWQLDNPISPAGLFTSLQPSASVQDLHVEGTISPKGAAEAIGGIAGENSGTMRNCSFSGIVSGSTAVGGIAGRNTGTITSCQTQGGIVGESMAGGIVGENHGILSNCVGNSYVNVESSDPSIELSDFSLKLPTSLSSLSAAPVVNIVSDSGGIAGYSDGSVFGCINHASVGYPHIGYNNGGIVGRNRGFLSGCINTGDICGRKEVGGITGQAEPFITVSLDENSLESIQTELHTMNQMLDQAVQDAKGSSDAISNRLTKLRTDASRASDNVKELSDALISYGDDTIDELNRGGDIASEAADQTADITSHIPGFGQTVQKSADEIEKALQELDRSKLAGSSAVDHLHKASDDMHTAAATLRSSQIPALENISSSVALIRSASSHLKEAKNELPEIAGETQNAANTAKDALETIDTAATELDHIFQDLSDLTDYLSDQDTLQITTPGSRIQPAANRLHTSMENISSQLELLNQDTSHASDLLANDIRAINNQFILITDKMVNKVNDLENNTFNDRMTDTSEANIDSVLNGKLLLCVNHGSVYGDLHVGGIAGSMGIYDKLNPEEDDTVSLSSTLKNQYELNAILKSCTNDGNITAKHNYVGSICGLAKLGVITDCEAYGRAVSENGSYVGGIAGAGNTIIRNSFSKCSLAGESCIGGIIGSGMENEDECSSVVRNCISLPEITDAAQFSGAIAGKDVGIFENNLFVSDTLTGLDRMNSSGRAEQVSYDALADKDLPSAFRLFRLTFVADDETLKTIRFRYGDSFDSSIYPEIPKKEDEYGVWDLDDLTNLHLDTQVNVRYAPYITVLSSSAKREDGRAAFLSEGHFDDQVNLIAEPVITPFDAPSQGFMETVQSYHREILEQWKLSVPEDALGDIHIRYLSPDGTADHLRVYQMSEEGWKPVSYETIGSYLSFPVSSGNTIITILKTSANWWIWLIIGVFLLLDALLILRYHLLTRLYHKAAPKIAQYSTQTAALLDRKKKLRNLLLTLLILCGLLCASLAFIMIRMPSVTNGVQLYRLLNHYDLQDDLDLDLKVDVSIGTQKTSLQFPIYTTKISDTRVSCVNLRGIPLYFSKGHMILEDGTAFRSEALTLDSSALLHHVTDMFRVLDITVSDNGSQKIYHTTADTEYSSAILSMLLPGWYDELADSKAMSVDLIMEEEKPKLLRFSWEGIWDNEKASPVSLMAELSFDAEQTEQHTLPMEVRTTVAGNFENAIDLSDEMREFLLALTMTTGKDSLTANIHLDANCGPLVLDDDITLQYELQDADSHIRIQKGKLSLNIIQNQIPESEDAAAVSQLNGLTRFLPAIYQAVMSGNASCQKTEDGFLFTLSLEEAEMKNLLFSISPELANTNLTISEGILTAELGKGHIQTVSVHCQGNARIAFVEIPSAITITADFPADGE